MLFRRIVISAVAVGICAGLFVSMVENMRLLQIILEAEQYEINKNDIKKSAQQHNNNLQSTHTAVAGHSHDDAIWTPENGVERFSYTLGSNIIAAIGFATILIALMCFGEKRVTLRSGFLWGISGFSVFFLSPALGLPPELPGMQAAEVGLRQSWWIMTVISTAAGLACIAFARKYYKLLGFGLLVLPHLVGAPQPGSNRFIHPDASVVMSLESLHSQFIQLVSILNFAYWLLLGILSALLVQRYIKRPIKLSSNNPPMLS